MSTRCQIAFYYGNMPTEYDDEKKERIALIYQTYDGDPKNMFNRLITYKNKHFKQRGFYDPSYLAARTLQQLANEADENAREWRNKDKPEEEDQLFSTGFGIDNEIHGDLSYLYQIYEDGIIIRYGDEDGDTVSPEENEE